MRSSAPSRSTVRRGASGRALRARFVGALVVASALGVLGSTLATSPGCTPEKGPPPSAEPPVIVGVSLGLSRGLSGFALPLRDAIRTAEGQINAAGGVLGRQITFEIRDDESDEDRGVIERIAEDFVARGAVAVIGPVGSQQVVKTQGIYARGNVLQISPSATSTDLTTIQPTNDRWLFRTTPADDFQGAAVLLFAQRTPRGLSDAGAPAAVDGGPITTCTKLAIVHLDNAYGKSMADVIEKNFPSRAGQPILARKSIPVSLLPDYKPLAEEVVKLEPECLALIAYDDVAAPFVRELKAHSGYAALEQRGFFVIGTDGVHTDKFLVRGRDNESDPTSPNVAVGIYGTAPDTQPGTKEYNEFKTLLSSYAPLGTNDAPVFAANTFDAAILIALAIQRAGTLADRAAIRQALLEVSTPPGRPFTPAQLAEAMLAASRGEDIDYKGASGAVDFEPNGNVKSGFVAWEAFRDAEKKVAFRIVGRFTLEELLGQLK